MPDVFDNLMIDVCDVVKKDTYGGSSDDAYGQPSQQFREVLSAWPCRVTTMAGGHEYKEGKEFAINTYRVFMRPPTVNDSGVPFQLDPHYWLRVTTANGTVLAKPFYLNITAVNDPSFLGHHLEIIGVQAIP